MHAPFRARSSHGTGQFSPTELGRCGKGVVFEDGVRIWHPDTVQIGDGVYIGHETMLKGYHNSTMVIGAGTWIGQMCFFHSAGGIEVGENVGIGPCVKILTSSHVLQQIDRPILHSDLEFAAVRIDSDADIGVGAVILPGVTIGRGAQIGAGAVVTEDIPPYAIAVGVPAQVVRSRR